ncbi:MAG: bifunctional riboflavin kinase/FAD synthetase [Nitratireductor sp.]
MPVPGPSSAVVVKGSANLPTSLSGCVVAIGNFDGVHRGHMAVVASALDQARANGKPVVALTFEPHPRSFFRPDHPVFRLTPEPEKCALLIACGFDGVVVETFDAGFAAVTAGDFVHRILAHELRASHVVAGHDFHFGKGRAGTPQFLLDEAAMAGFGVTLVEPFCDEVGEIISSSRIRRCLGSGDITTANSLLGRPWSVSGIVIHGKKLGRTLGYPTANLLLPPENRLAHGIYAVEVRRADGTLHQGVASFGRRPTFDNGEALLETFIFDFSGDLYGEEIAVIFHGFLRGEEKFDGIEALVAQMGRDSAQAREVLAKSNSAFIR